MFKKRITKFRPNLVYAGHFPYSRFFFEYHWPKGRKFSQG